MCRPSICPSVYEILWSLAHIGRSHHLYVCTCIYYAKHETMDHRTSFIMQSQSHIHMNYDTENAYDANYPTQTVLGNMKLMETGEDKKNKNEPIKCCFCHCPRYHKREHHIYMRSIPPMNSISDMNGSHFTIFIFHNSNRALRPTNRPTDGRRILHRKKKIDVFTLHSLSTKVVHRCLATTPSWLLFEFDRVKYRYNSQCIYNSDRFFFSLSRSSFVCFLDVHFLICEFIHFTEATATGRPVSKKVPQNTLNAYTLLPLCSVYAHYWLNGTRCASKMIYCQNVGRARGHFTAMCENHRNLWT